MLKLLRPLTAFLILSKWKWVIVHYLSEVYKKFLLVILSSISYIQYHMLWAIYETAFSYLTSSLMSKPKSWLDSLDLTIFVYPIKSISVSLCLQKKVCFLLVVLILLQLQSCQLVNNASKSPKSGQNYLKIASGS